MYREDFGCFKHLIIDLLQPMVIREVEQKLRIFSFR